MTEKKDRLMYWHIHCVNCGKKICKYKKEVKDIDEIKVCSFCEEEIRIIIGCKIKVNIFTRQSLCIINNIFEIPK